MKKIPGFLPVKSVSWDKQILENSGFFKKNKTKSLLAALKSLECLVKTQLMLHF